MRGLMRIFWITGVAAALAAGALALGGSGGAFAQTQPTDTPTALPTSTPTTVPSSTAVGTATITSTPVATATGTVAPTNTALATAVAPTATVRAAQALPRTGTGSGGSSLPWAWIALGVLGAAALTGGVAYRVRVHR